MRWRVHSGPRRFALAIAERIMAKRPPDFVVGSGDIPYMQRWWVIPRNRIFNIYLHRFLHDDDDRALHDHPWASLTWVIKGGYIEYLKDGHRLRTLGDLCVRSASTAHRVELFKDGSSDLELGAHTERPIQATTLFFTGPSIREWGFHCPNGWVHWKDFVDDRDKGKVGKGCG